MTFYRMFPVWHKQAAAAYIPGATEFIQIKYFIYIYVCMCVYVCVCVCVNGWSEIWMDNGLQIILHTLARVI